MDKPCACVGHVLLWRDPWELDVGPVFLVGSYLLAVLAVSCRNERTQFVCSPRYFCLLILKCAISFLTLLLHFK